MPTQFLRRGVGAAATAAVACSLFALAPLSASATVVPTPVSTSTADPSIRLTPLGSFETGVFDGSAAEIVAAYAGRLFVVNAQAGSVSVVDMRDPAAMSQVATVSGDGIANSVAVRADGLGVVAIESHTKTDPGHLLFFDANAADPTVLGTVAVGALPDMVTFSPDGAYAVVANEGEPADDFSVDPEGSVSVVTLPTTVAAPGQDAVRTADFHAFEGGALPAGVRVFGPTPHGDDLPVSRNLEPEYVTVVGTTAYVALQEANAIAEVDLASAAVTAIRPLGFKDHGLEQNALDPSDKDGAFSLRAYAGLRGLYMPDGIASYEADGGTYLVTANEGDAREWGSYAESIRVKDLGKKGVPPVCADSPLASKTADAELGRLNVTRADGLRADGSCYENLYAFGGRSFSIWSTDGTQVFDSGSDFERITAEALPGFVNSNHTEANFEGRSDDKGPEPENVAIGAVGGRTYAFVGLERVAGVMVYDITVPARASFVTYVNNRDFSVADPSANLAAAGDLGPEGLTFLPATVSPTGKPALAVANEVSGTTTLFGIEDLTTTDVQVLTINDFHGRIEPNFASGEAGAAVLSGAVASFRAKNPNTVFASAGDNIGASTFASFIDKDTPTIDALKAAGLQVSAVGNHEFDAGFADLTDRVLPRYGDTAADRRHGLGANVYDRATGKPALQEYAVEEVDGVRVALIGTVTEQTAAMVSPDGIADIRFGSQLEAANRVAAEITAAGAADVVILLAHDGNDTATCADLAGASTDFGRLAREASGDIDAIVSGHTHQSYACEIAGPAGERPVIQAHQYGTTLGKLDLTVDTRSKQLVSISGSTVPLVKDGKPLFDADPEVAKIVADATAYAEVEGSKPAGRISADILRGGTKGSDRGVESSLGNLAADQYLWAATDLPGYAGAKAQIGLINPGGLRADLLYGTDGKLVLKDVAAVQPFANTLVTMTLTGAQLKSVLEEQWQPDGSSRPKLHLGVSDGFGYTYLPDNARGERVTSMTFRGKRIQPADSFTVVTNSFLAAGGDNFPTFKAGTARADTGQVDLHASLAYFANHDVVDPAPLGRAVVGDGTVQPTEPWAKVSVGSGSVAQGGTLQVQVTGLTPGRQIAAVLHSDPITATGIPAADANGSTAFGIAIPKDFAPGAHTLVVSAEGAEPIETAVTVTEAGTTEPTQTPTPTPTPTATPDPLAVTGAEAPFAVALLASMLVAAGLLTVALRRRA